MSAAEGVLVLSTARKVHDLSCPTLSDYTDGRRLRTLADGGWTEQSFPRLEDHRVTRTDVEAGAHGRYQRCLVCAPEVSEWVERPIERPKSASKVCGEDIGRETSIGTLLGVVANADRVILTLSGKQSVSLRHEETVVFFQARAGAA